MNKDIKEILDNLRKTADNSIFVVCSSQEELDKIPKYTANFLSINDRQAKILLDYITTLQNAEQEIEKLNNIIDKQDRDIVALSNGNRKLKTRIDKAIEYINKLQENDDIEIWRENGYWAYILYILQGSDKE